jgi:N-acetylglucosamine kinase
MQRHAAASTLDCAHLVLNDVEVAYDGAFAGDDGVLVLAGTGSMAWAKTHGEGLRGESLRVGGWGEAFGDEGSAYWIGREALSLASQGLDGRRDIAAFAKAMLDVCGIDAQGLIGWAYGQKNGRAAFAALAEHVSRIADAGNTTAIDLLQAAARYLAEHADAARQKLGQPALGWSYAGSVFRSVIVLQETSRLLGQPQRPKLTPLGGSIWRAAGLAGWDGDTRFIQSLGASLETNLKEAK